MNHLTPRQAYDYLLAHPEAVFIDCRSEAEYFLVGHPLVERSRMFQEDLDETDPWQFKNVRVV
jgi:hypothetical protein